MIQVIISIVLLMTYFYSHINLVACFIPQVLKKVFIFRQTILQKSKQREYVRNSGGIESFFTLNPAFGIAICTRHIQLVSNI